MFTVALSGGRITKTFFGEIVAQAKPAALAGVHFFWADERCVAPTNPDSNFALAQSALFTPLGIAGDFIHRLRGEADPAFAVAEADAELCRVAEMDSSGMPLLDLVFLGMGEDGHVASLFPGAAAEVEQGRGPFLHLTNSPKPPPNRLTLTYAALAAAREVWVLAAGAGKEAALRESLSAAGRTPLARVIRLRPRTKLFTDQNL
ncbi:MAG: 6-phosphogluconolactonase [Verrucomicrobia bacterium]|nr:6-phosphogluconolactonase [Verrucomicrobiota bacterium]